MKRRALLFSLLAGAAFSASFPELANVRNVYILPMSGGLDQFLAQSLTKQRQFQVVADPNAADAIFTDRLGEPFEKKLTELYPPPPPPEKPKKDGDKDGKKDKDDEVTIKQEPAVRMGGFAPNRGNVFLVERASKKVLWSFYKRPKSTTPDDVNRTAEAIVADLKKDILGKKD